MRQLIPDVIDRLRSPNGLFSDETFKRFGFGPTELDCVLCHFHIKIIDHLFLHGEWSSKVWVACMKWWEIVSCVNETLVGWFSVWSSLCPNQTYGRAWEILFSVVVWSIWECRNHKIFNDKKAFIQQTVDIVKFRLVWWFKHCGKGSNHQISLMRLNVKDRFVDNIVTKRVNSDFWKTPAEGVLKFNVDGSAKGSSGPPVMRGVLRDLIGKVLCLFSFFLGIQDLITAEIMAIHKACDIVQSSSSWCGRNVVISSDSMVAMSWVYSGDFGSLVHVNTIYGIRN
ncbi:hypothetical protein Dsin_009341 [Dipteronia sinensis]|uniref:RNase H type-1 domain-containing protein n=1 Tax=Dipteronia sinensis TaxID=43782 RepID=A0AAE0AQH0_9ROSI|nr:hypothetical protein Dsin_009341 [Dipteronia sinensis]